ncbi:MAG TPA: hypothetical protein VFQ43_09725, partial [Nitrososphaera sp.]|nr:hypothetical protein [Nitrososphaera sp.]
YLPPQITEDNKKALKEPEPLEGIEGFQGVIEKFLFIIDPRQPGPTEKVFSEDFMPHPFHFRRLSEKPVAAHVEVETFIALGSGEATYDVSLFNDYRADIALG